MRTDAPITAVLTADEPVANAFGGDEMRALVDVLFTAPQEPTRQQAAFVLMNVLERASAGPSQARAWADLLAVGGLPVALSLAAAGRVGIQLRTAQTVAALATAGGESLGKFRELLKVRYQKCCFLLMRVLMWCVRRTPRRCAFCCCCSLPATKMYK